MDATSIVIVGSGPAGLAATLAAVEAGAAVTLVDEHPTLGGHWRWSRTPLDGITPELEGCSGLEAVRQLIERIRALEVTVLTETTVWALFPDRTLALSGPQGSRLLQPSQLVLATGAIERRVPFPGWLLPGVLTAREALQLLATDPAALGQRLVLIGSGPDADTVADTLVQEGRDVIRFPALPNLAAEGHGHVERVWVDGYPLSADGVVLALGHVPDAALAQQAGAQLVFDQQIGWWRVQRDASLQTTLAGVFVAGEAGGAQSDAEAWLEGRLAGLAAAGAHDLALLETDGALRAVRAMHLQSGDPYSPEWAAMLPDDLPICRCEQVTVGAVRAAIADGARSLNDIKRRTRTGMGECQGAWCSLPIACLLSSALGQPRSALLPLTARPPARPIPLAALATLTGEH